MDTFKTFKVTQTKPGGPLNESLVGAVQASGGAADAGKVVLLASSGKIDSSMISGGGSTVSVNGTPVSSPDFNGSAPSPGGGYTAVVWTSDIGGDVSAWYSAGGTPSFGVITSGTNTTAAMVVGTGASLGYAGSGVLNANEIGTVNIDGNLPMHAGEILISQPGNTTALWADPLVQGVFPPGTYLPTANGASPPSPLNPILVGAQNPSGLLENLHVDASGNLNVNVQVGGSSSSVNVSQWGGTATTLGQKVSVSSVPVVIASDQSAVSVTGTVAVTQSTSPWVVSLASTTVTGTVAVTQSTSPWVVQDLAAEASLTTLASVVETTGSPAEPTLRVSGTVTGNDVVDAGNSSTTPLSATFAFTGAWHSALGYSALQIAVDTDQISAATSTAGLVVNWSEDGVNVGDFDIAYVTATDVLPTGQSFIFPVKRQYYQVVYTNGSVTQATFRLQTTLKANPINGVITDLADILTSGMHGQLVRSVLAGTTPTGTYANVNISTEAALNMSGSGAASVGAYTYDPTHTAPLIMVSNSLHYNSVAVEVVSSGSISAGSLTFQVSIDNIHWIALAGVNVGTQMTFNGVYSLIGTSGAAAFIFNITGFNYFRIFNDTAISGTGSPPAPEAVVSYTVQGLAAPNVSSTVNTGTITVNSSQGTPNSTGNAWPIKVTDGTNIAAVKAASTAAIATDPALVVAISPNNTPAVTVSGTVGITGSVGVTQSTSPWVVSQGTASLLNATVVGTLSNNNAAPTATNVGVLPAVANAAPPGPWTEGDQVLQSVDLQGSHRIRPGSPATANWTCTPVNFNTLGVNNIGPAAVAGKTVRVMRLFLVNCNTTTTTNITIQDTNSIPVTFTGPVLLISSGVLNHAGDGEPYYVSTSGKQISVNSSAAVQISGAVWTTQS